MNDNKQPLILIIEDNPSDLRVLGNLVNHLGEVIFATSGESGLILAQHRKPDLILLDVELPDINGFKICSELKNCTKLKMPPLFLSPPIMTNTVK